MRHDELKPFAVQGFPSLLVKISPSGVKTKPEPLPPTVFSRLGLWACALFGLCLGAIGLVLLAETDPARRGKCGCLGHAHEFEGEVAVGDVAGLRRVCVHGAFLRTGGVGKERSRLHGCRPTGVRRIEVSALRAIG